MNNNRFIKFALASAMSAAIMTVAAQDSESTGQIEETVVIGTLRSAAGDIVAERLESETVVDILGAEQIARVGDSTVAQALTRVPGITLIGGQFIYVRGLGERYSSTLLNGARVPSPDLSRSVLPLDIFPASILDSLSIEKGFSADKPAAFGGGSIDIRTKGVPDDFVFSIQLGGSFNTDAREALSYSGGSDDVFGTDDGLRALSSDIEAALDTFASDFFTSEVDPSLSPISIQRTMDLAEVEITLEEAEAINADLATGINRDLSIRGDSTNLPRDFSGSVSLGNLFYVGNKSEIGVLSSVGYENSTRSVERIARTVTDPNENFEDESQTTDNVGITGSLNAGWRYGEDHELTTTNIFLRDTDDDVSITDIFNTTSGFSTGQGIREFDYRFEERQFFVNQFAGTHFFGAETQDLLGLGDRFRFLEQLELNWFVSNAQTTTLIPSETNLQATTAFDVNTGEIISTVLSPIDNLLSTSFTDLDEDLDSAGWELELPFFVGDWQITLSGGAKFDQQERSFAQTDLTLGTTNTLATDVLTLESADPGDISRALSDQTIQNPDLDFELNFVNGLSNSYLAATDTDAYFGQADFRWNETWRFTFGLRFEDYQQFSVPFEPNRLSGSPLIDFRPTEILESTGFPEGVFLENDFYPSFAFTWSRPGFAGAEDFNVRFGFSETVVRPDLREISDSSYLDDRLNIVVSGNPEVIPSSLRNFDARAEWFFGNGDSLTISAFFKDIDNPIELFRDLGSEDSISATIENADTGESLGIELEFLKSLDLFGSFASQFFLSGNFTLADSEIDVGDLDANVTNDIRSLEGASDFVVNLQLGFDSHNNKHSGALAYNVFGERIFIAGVSTQDDSFEQPFNSLDLAYSYYASNNFTIKAKLRNILDDNIEITQDDPNFGNVTVFEQTVGRTLSFDVQYDF